MEKGMKQEVISEISVNINDMTGEEIGYLLNVAIEEGAQDAYAQPVFKRNQHPAHIVTVLCKKEETTFFCKLLLKHSTAFDLHLSKKHKISLHSEIEFAETSLGVVRYYKSGGKRHIEYEDLVRAARRNGLNMAVAREKILGEIGK